MGRVPAVVVRAAGIAKEVRIARTFALTAYDAEYLVVAQTHAARLATFDRKLREAATTGNIEIFDS